MTRTRKVMGLSWLVTLALLLLASQFDAFLDRHNREFLPLDIIILTTRVAFAVVTIYWIAVAIRWVLRKLFWRVGRRLALSYFFIGVMPFIFFAIMLVVMAYMVGGVLSRSAVRAERQATLVRMDRWNLEYSLTGKKPADQFSTTTIHDSASAPLDVPKWLRSGSFSGLVKRGKEPLFVSAKSFRRDGKERTIVIVQPMDEVWAREVEQRSGMILSAVTGTYTKSAPGDGNLTIETDDDDEDPQKGGPVVSATTPEGKVRSNDEEIQDFLRRAWSPGRIVWADVSAPLAAWETGETGDYVVLTGISNPIRNVIDTYFGGSEYVHYLIVATVAVGSFLLIVYLLAALFAAVLIFSISRAVNRIEKGTKAVEKGDFSYRIRMKPHNQLGEMAQSFDRMTESIGSLLQRVAEQERLQSEIDIAASIQRNLLPKEGPTAAGVSFSAHFAPTASIGGDYYDVFNLDRNRLAVAIGDVSGHGLSTGLVMAMVKAAITTLVEEGADEYSLFIRLNELVLRSTEKRAFMTLGFTIFDLEHGTIRHTNAGHLYPYVIRRGEVLTIEAPSVPLGLKSDVVPKTATLTLEQEDTIVYLSDGIIEAQNELGDPFGFDATEAILRKAAGTSAAAVQEALLAAVEKHCGGKTADDDRTVMIIRFDCPGLGRSTDRAELVPLEEEMLRSLGPS